MGIEPSGLIRHVTVMTLFNTTRPTSHKIRLHPASVAGWRAKIEGAPRMASGGVFEHTTPLTHSRESGGKATAIVAQLILMGLVWSTVPVPAPAFTGGMSD